MLSGRVEQHGRYKQAKPLKIIWAWVYLLREDRQDSAILEDPNFFCGKLMLLKSKIFSFPIVLEDCELFCYQVKSAFILQARPPPDNHRHTMTHHRQWFRLMSHRLKAVLWRPDRAWSCYASCGLNQMPGLLSKGNMEEGAFCPGWPEEELVRYWGSWNRLCFPPENQKSR